MKHERAHERGKGDIGGGGMPTRLGGTEGDMNKSLDGASMTELYAGYTPEGGITSATKSDSEKVPGTNNKDATV